jgi:hypothetical protein
LLDINRGDGKLFYTAYIMPKFSSALYGRFNPPPQNTSVPRKPVLQAPVLAINKLTAVCILLGISPASD